MSTKALRALLGDKVVGYKPILAKVSGGAAEGVLLSQLLYWEQRMDAARGPEWDGWFWKVAHEIYEETGMSRSEFETARANLIKRGFIEYESRGVPMRAHYRIDIDKIQAALESADEFAKAHARKFTPKQQPSSSGDTTNDPQDTAIQFVENEHVENEHVENEHTNLPETDTPVCLNSANWNAQNGQTIQEITSLDFQQIPRKGETPAFKTQIQTHLRSTFHIPPDDSWDWLDALCAEIPDETFLTEQIDRTRAMQSHTVFDRIAFVRTTRHRYLRSNRAAIGK